MLLFTTFAVPYLLAFGEDIDPTKKLDGFQVRQRCPDGRYVYTYIYIYICIYICIYIYVYIYIYT